MVAFVAAAVFSGLPASGWARPATPPEAGSFRYLPRSASRRTKFLQFHGFGTAAGDAQVSDGSTRDDQDPNPSSVSVALRDALRLIAPNKTIFSCQVDGMGGGRKLCGTTNIEGRSSNEASGADECRAPTAQSTDRFLHLERVRTFRNLDVEQHLVERALSSVWGDCNLAEDGADCDLGDPQPSFADYSCSDHVPVASAGPNRTVECASPSGTSVLLDATASSDPDGMAVDGWRSMGSKQRIEQQQRREQ